MLRSDLIFHLEDGETTEECVAHLKENVAARLLGISTAKSLVTMQFDPNVEGVGYVGPKEQIPDARSIDDVYKHPQNYATGCGGWMVLAQNKAGSYSRDFYGSNVWIPGDGGYIYNLNHKRNGGQFNTPGLEGENIMSVGNDKFIGHFGGTLQKDMKTLDQWKAEIRGWDGNGKPLESSARSFPLIGLQEVIGPKYDSTLPPY